MASSINEPLRVGQQSSDGTKNATKIKKLPSNCCCVSWFGMSLMLIVAGIVMLEVGNRLCDTEFDYCCTTENFCGSNNNNVQTDFGPCANGIAENADDQGICNCGGSEQQCNLFTFTCPDLNVVSSQCIPASKCCAGSASALIISAIVFFVVFSISGCCTGMYSFWYIASGKMNSDNFLSRESHFA